MVVQLVGRETWGIFPLRGKPLNVRGQPAERINKNAEISNIKKILGLQHGQTYTDVSDLRYGSVVCFADADLDGEHITGLIINFFHSQYPSLLKIPGFLRRFVTPVLKVTRGKESKAFYTQQDFDAWKATPESAGWSNPKYYKVRLPCMLQSV